MYLARCCFIQHIVVSLDIYNCGAWLVLCIMRCARLRLGRYNSANRSSVMCLLRCYAAAPKTQSKKATANRTAKNTRDANDKPLLLLTMHVWKRSPRFLFCRHVIPYIARERAHGVQGAQRVINAFLVRRWHRASHITYTFIMQIIFTATIHSPFACAVPTGH